MLACTSNRYAGRRTRPTRPRRPRAHTANIAKLSSQALICYDYRYSSGASPAVNNELADTTRRYDAGTVPRFSVLRAKVELTNARPKLISALRDYSVARARLERAIGINTPAP